MSSGARASQARRRRRPTPAALRAAIGHLRTLEVQPQVRIALAEALFRLAVAPGTPDDEALDLVREAVANDPCHPKLYLHLGRLLHRDGRYRAAVREYRRALALVPSNRRAHLLLAQALLELDPPEQEIGRRLLAALTRDSADESQAASADLDILMQRRRSEAATQAKKTGRADNPGRTGQPGGDSENQPGQAQPGRRRGNQRGTPPPPASGTGWAGSWRVSLFEQISREKPNRRWVDAHLETGRARVAEQGRVAEFATTCILMLAAGEHPRDVRQLIESADLVGGAGTPAPGETTAAADDGAPASNAAVAMAAASVDLAEITDGSEFVDQAARHVESGVLPIELMSWLHFSQFGPGSDLEPGAALRLLDEYPPAMQQDPTFRELKLAVLDGYARLAWSDDRLERARLLWKETIPLDPFRVPVALNLALLAARMRAQDEYEPAWDRLFELLYLRAAGAGDVQYLLEDRKMMHAALCQQSLQRHCTLRAGQIMLAEEEAAALAADPDAVEVWLREWDRYYLNARLGFRSPVHLLGVPRDASPEDLQTARTALDRHLALGLDGEDWAGLGVFRQLAAARISDDYARASDLLERARDGYYELEKAEADALVTEALTRGIRLLCLTRALRAQPSTRHIRTGSAIARHQLVLPWAVLRPICVDRGLVGADDDLVSIFEDELIALATRCWNEPAPTDERAWSSVLRDIGECVAVLPHRIELRLLHCRIFFEAERHDEAYAAAIEALKLDIPGDDAEQVDDLRDQLVKLIDEIAIKSIPATLLNPKNADDARTLLAAGRQALDRFPASCSLRVQLANLMVQLGDEAESAHAVKLVEEGINNALDDRQRQDLENELSQVRAGGEHSAWVKAHVNAVVDEVNQALQRVQDAPSRDGLSATRLTIRQAIERLERDLTAAQAAHRKDQIEALKPVLADLRGLEQQLPSE